MGILFLVLDFVIIFFAAYVINKDIDSKNLDQKYFLIWLGSLIIVYLLADIFGVLIVFVAYLIWSWVFSNKTEKNSDYDVNDKVDN